MKVRTKSNNEETYKSQGRLLANIPTFLLQIVLHVAAYFGQYLNVTFKPIGLLKRLFGSIIITSIGSQGYIS